MRTWTFAAVVVVAAAGCGGGGGVGSGNDGGAGSGGGTTGAGGAGGATSVSSCGKVEPCGGDVLGTWNVSATCVLDASFLTQLTSSGSADIMTTCAGASLVPTGATAQGSSTFSQDGTFQQTGTVTFGMKLTLPVSCFAAGKSCADLQTTYDQDPTIKQANCGVTGGACVCTLGLVIDVTDSGTYTKAGTSITETGQDGTPSTDPYCVVGNEYHDLAVDMTMPVGPMGLAKIQADTVLVKQP